MSLWFTSAPFCSRNSQAIKEPWQRHRDYFRILKHLDMGYVVILACICYGGGWGVVIIWLCMTGWVGLDHLGSLTPITAWISGVFPSSSSLAVCTSAPWANASAMRGRLWRREARWSNPPGWSSLGSSGSDGTSCSISTSPLDDSSDSSSKGQRVTEKVAMTLTEFYDFKYEKYKEVYIKYSEPHTPSSVTLSTTEPNTRMSVLPSVLPPRPLSLLRPAGPNIAKPRTR